MRVAMISMHTSPLEQPGIGDAGGMNVYVRNVASHLASHGVEVDVFTRATRASQGEVVEVEPGFRVINCVAGPFEGLAKESLPTQLTAFTGSVIAFVRAEAARRSDVPETACTRTGAGIYDLIHTHYWLSGQVGWLARDRWAVPLVHTAHTLAAVKNASLAEGDTPEPPMRQVGEQQVVDEADRLIVNTETEAQQLISIHHADPSRIDVVTPGADLECYTPGPRIDARLDLGLDPDEVVVTFVGRIQPLKAPDVLLRAAAPLIRRGLSNGRKLRVLVAGGPSGSGLERPTSLIELSRDLGIESSVTFIPPQSPESLAKVYRASNVVAVPSYSESFGLVAIEAQAAGIPVLAADVGGLGVAVDNGVSGVLVDGHGIDRWTGELDRLLGDETALAAMGEAAHRHAQNFSWDHTADQLLASYGRAIDSFRRNRAQVSNAPDPGTSQPQSDLSEESTPHGVVAEPEARPLARMARRFAGRRNGART